MLEASSIHAWQVAIWTTLIGVGFLTLVGLARAGSILFWHVRDDAPGSTSGASPKLISATLVLLAATVAMSVWAAPIQRYTAQAAAQLLDREAYARAVLGEAGLGAQTTRPYGFPVARVSARGAAPAGYGGE
jgi:multicomponent K+:H+ antiporter subunit D